MARPRGGSHIRRLLVAQYETIQKEVQNATPERKLELIQEGTRVLDILADFEKVRARRVKPPSGGRPRKVRDSKGQPLYQGIEPKVKEDTSARSKFLEGLGAGPTEETENVE